MNRSKAIAIAAPAPAMPFSTKALVAAVAAAAVLAALLLATSPARAQQRANVRVGTLDCAIGGGVGLIITSQKEMYCRFVPANGSRSERYAGAIRKFGLDIGVTQRGQMIWAVYAATRPGPGMLGGDYVGGSAEATVGAGIGANALFGGAGRSFALQPLSVQGQIGANLALGVSQLSLRPLRPVVRR